MNDNEIFLSYCWANEDSPYVEEIDEAFEKRGIILTRDKRDTEYKDSFREFMARIRITDAVILVISEDYLKSRNCMYEVLEAYKDENFKERIFPIILPNTNIYSEKDILQKYEYWGKIYLDLKERIKQVEPDAIGDMGKNLKVYLNIKTTIIEFLGILRDLNVQPYKILKENGFQNLVDKLPFTIPSYNKENPNLHINRNQHILDQTYNVIVQLYGSINYYPLDLLVDQYPFCKEERSYSYHSFFHISLSILHTDNEELFNLFQEITRDSVEDATILKIPNYEVKINTIINKLYISGVYCIKSIRSHKKVELKNARLDLLDDIQYKLDTYQYVECYRKLFEYDLDLKQLLKYAFVAYRLGEYLQSAKYLLKAYKISTQNKDALSTNIVIYNLKRLKERFLYSKEDDKEISQLIDDVTVTIGKANLEELDTMIHNEYADTIKNNLFYTYKYEEINEIVKNIRNHYYSQLNRGHSNNNSAASLLHKSFEFIQFINKSYIFFEHYSNFQNLIRLIIEGLFASHAISEKGGSRLNSIDDFTMLLIIDYSKTKNIFKYFNRYKLVKINYQKLFKGQSLLKQVINNFFVSLMEFITHPDKYKLNDFFLSNFKRVFDNIIAIVSLTNFTNDYLNEFTVTLLDFLEKENLLNSNDLEYVMAFFKRVSIKIDSKYLNRILTLSLSNKKYHNNLGKLVAAFNKKNEFISLNDDQIENIKKSLIHLSENYSQFNSQDDFIKLISIIQNKKHRIELGEVVFNQLKKKFNFHLYCTALIYGTIEHDEELFKSAEKYILSKEKPKNEVKLFRIHQGRDSSIDEFINLAFALGVNMKSKKFEPIRNYDDYYCWLLNLDSFDYDKFDPEWILVYGSFFYVEKFYNSSKLKSELEKRLSNGASDQVKKEYLDIYVIRDWENALTKWREKNKFMVN